MSPLESQREGPELRAALNAVRAHTLALLADVSDEDLRAAHAPSWSPLGWHLGHVAYTEARFLLRDPALVEAMAAQLSQEHSPKAERSARLPPRRELERYVEDVRARVLARFEALDPALVRFVLQHERQHAETITVVRQVARLAGAVPGAGRGANDVGEGRGVGRDDAATGAIERLRAVAPDQAADPMRADEAAERLRAGGGAVRADAAEIPGGRGRLGGEGDPFAYDNELPARTVRPTPFALSRVPVTCGAWRAFVEDGGYDDPGPWTEAGFAWRRAHDVRRPASWEPDGSLRTPFGTRPFDPDLPVFGISHHEARAFARWAGARLPTEDEWEWAARFDPAAEAGGAAETDDTSSDDTSSDGASRIDVSGGARARTFPWGEALPDDTRCNAGCAAGGPLPVAARPAGASALGLHDLAGQVWEWTASPFAPPPGFLPWPYRGYSAPYFDGRHLVLKGGSFATLGSILRCAFRNWYQASVREVFAGVRLAWDLAPPPTRTHR